MQAVSETVVVAQQCSEAAKTSKSKNNEKTKGKEDGDHDDEVLEQAIIGGAEGVASTDGCVAGLLLGASGSALLQTSAS